MMDRPRESFIPNNVHPDCPFLYICVSCNSTSSKPYCGYGICRHCFNKEEIFHKSTKASHAQGSSIIIRRVLTGKKRKSFGEPFPVKRRALPAAEEKREPKSTDIIDKILRKIKKLEERVHNYESKIEEYEKRFAYYEDELQNKDTELNLVKHNLRKVMKLKGDEKQQSSFRDLIKNSQPTESDDNQPSNTFVDGGDLDTPRSSPSTNGDDLDKRWKMEIIDIINQRFDKKEKSKLKTEEESRKSTYKIESDFFGNYMWEPHNLSLLAIKGENRFSPEFAHEEF